MTNEWEQTMPVSWLKCQQTSSFSPGHHSALPNSKPIPAFPSLCCSVYRNVLSCPFQSWLWEGCQHMCFSSWRRTCPQSSQSGGFRSALQRFLFISLQLQSSFSVGEPWSLNFMNLPHPALISPWNCLICDNFFPHVYALTSFFGCLEQGLHIYRRCWITIWVTYGRKAKPQQNDG